MATELSDVSLVNGLPEAFDAVIAAFRIGGRGLIDLRVCGSVAYF